MAEREEARRLAALGAMRPSPARKGEDLQAAMRDGARLARRQTPEQKFEGFDGETQTIPPEDTRTALSWSPAPRDSSHGGTTEYTERDKPEE